MQVLQLAPEQISALDPGQRDSVMQLVSAARSGDNRGQILLFGRTQSAPGGEAHWG
jgi:hypothetical protein